MARRVFFSFHYQDVIDFRANVVRNHWMTKSDREEAGFFDASIWEKAKKEGEVALKRLINDGLENTSNTCILAGSHTYERTWVRYEIMKSFVRGNHIFVIHINSINDKNQQTKAKGPNPLDYVGVFYSEDGRKMSLVEWNGQSWVPYTKIEGKSDFPITKIGVGGQGNSYKFSQIYHSYDWSINDGYNNFASWVK